MLGKCLQEFQHCRILLGSEEARVKIGIFQLRQINCHIPINKLFPDLSELRGSRFTQCDLSSLKKTDDLFAGFAIVQSPSKPAKRSSVFFKLDKSHCVNLLPRNSLRSGNNLLIGM